MPTRRQFLHSASATAAVAALSPRLRALEGPAAPNRQSLRLFDYPQVQLLPSPLQAQFDHNHRLFLNLSDDALLKPFRLAAGQPAPGDDMAGWYTASPLFDPPRNMTGYIPGHSFGQYLSALARKSAITADPATRAKVDALVRGFAPTITPDFYKGYCLPAYTFEKTLCGLSDAHQFAHAPDALAALNHATDAALPWLPEKALNRAELAARPHPNVAYTWDESYTLPENLYLAFTRGAGPRFHALAQRFLEDDTYFNPLAAGENVLPGQHAYSHVNALNSAVQAWFVDGSNKHKRAACNGFTYIQQQSYATGGWGPNESFQKPATEDLAHSLDHTHNSFEVPCGAYGHFKLTRNLLLAIGDAFYGDSMETVLFNTILGARPIQPDGTSFYYADYNTNAHKADYEQKWPCCSGTFPQLTADYGISTYFRSPDGVHVNLYHPSTLAWRQGSARATLTQQTAYPRTEDIHFTLTLSHAEPFTLAFRIPAWAGPQTTLRVNRTQVPAEPGSFASIHRTWRTGDRITLTLHQPLRLVPLDAGHPNLVALMRGPQALFALSPESVPPGALTRQALLSATPSSTGWQVQTARQPVHFLTYPEITTQTYRLYHQL